MDRKSIIKESTIQEDNIRILEKYFPNAIIKDNENYIIDSTKLQDYIGSCKVQEDGYGLSWAGQDIAIDDTNKANDKLLNPRKDISNNFDNTSNILIKGDNLDALKLLRSSYKEKIKMIYIDPPYNTKSDEFKYNDNFKMTQDDLEDYFKNIGYTENYIKGLKDIFGTKSHSGWLTFMYPRIALARELLRDDGIIFVSIDDNEQAQLKILMDGIFGSNNFIEQVVWERSFASKNIEKFISTNHEYILIYKKSEALEKLNGLPRVEKQLKFYNNLDNDPRGRWCRILFTVMGNGNRYEIINPAGTKLLPPAGRGWLYNENKYKELLADNRVWFGKDGTGTPYYKKFLSEVSDNVVCPSIWQCRKDDDNSVGHTYEATVKLRELFNGEKVFDFPKGTRLIKHMLQIATKPEDDDIILDFFAGSGTTGHAVLEKNLEDKSNAIKNNQDPSSVGNRKYIMVQLDEKIKDSRFNTVFDICHERMNKVADKIKNENTEMLDTGFKVFDIIKDENKIVYKSLNECIDQKFQNLNLFNEIKDLPALLYSLINNNCTTLDNTVSEIVKDKVYLCDNKLYFLDAVTDTDLINIIKNYDFNYVTIYSPNINSDQFSLKIECEILQQKNSLTKDDIKILGW